jgi:hypothetical protein
MDLGEQQMKQREPRENKIMRGRSITERMKSTQPTCRRAATRRLFLLVTSAALSLFAGTDAAWANTSPQITSTGSMSTSRKDHVATVLTNGCVLITGGRDSDGNILSSAEVFNPATGQFTSLGDMSAPRVGHTLTLLKNGKVLIAGGSNNVVGVLDTAEIFQPISCDTGTFYTVASMNNTRYGHTATVLTNADGWVLLVGGEPNRQTAEVFRPSTETFDSIYGDSPKVPHAWHTATLLSNSKVVLAGSGAMGTSTNADIFTPFYGTISQFQLNSTFTKTSVKMYAARMRQSAVQTIDGNVLLFNGDTARTIERFWTNAISSGGSFTFTANLSATNSPATNTTATLLGNEKVLFLCPSKASLFTLPATPSDLNIANVSMLKRGGHTAIEVPSSRQILVAGGVDNSNNLVSAGALYNPVSVTAAPDNPTNSETVYITGAGWYPGDNITLTYYNSDTSQNLGQDSTVVDASGNFGTTWHTNLNCTAPVSCTAADLYGESATCSFTYRVEETTPPTITCPGNVVTNTEFGVCYQIVNFVPTVSDNCPGVTYVCNPASGSQFNKGTNDVTCTATDTSSNTNSCSFTVTVRDLQSPTWNSCPSNVVQDTCAGQSNTVTYTAPQWLVDYFDNCGTATFSCNPTNGARFAHGTNTVTCTATDDSGNQASCAFTILVWDTNPPYYSWVEPDKTNNISSGCTGAMSYNLPIVGKNNSCGIVSNTCLPPSSSIFTVGVTTVNCIAKDGENNTVTTNFNIWVKQPIRPKFVTYPLTNIVTIADPAYDCAGRWVDYSLPSAVSTCAGPVTVICSNLTAVPPANAPPGSWFGFGTNTVNCYALDVSGNYTNGSFKVIVDTRKVPPSLYLFGETYDAGSTYSVTTNISGTCSAVVSYAYVAYTNSLWRDLPGILPATNWTAIPNCSAVSIKTNFCVPPSGTRFPAGLSNVVCKAVDNLSNTSTLTFTVAVLDSVLPTFTQAPKNTNVFAYANQCSRSNIVYSPALAANDNCFGTSGIKTNFCVPPTGKNTFFLGSSNVTCYAVDKSLNTNTTNFVVTVLDNIRPTLNACPSNIVTNVTDQAAYPPVVTFTPPTASDNCSNPPPTASCSPASGSSFSQGTNVVTCTAVDGSGNITNCTFKIIVSSKVAPTFTSFALNTNLVEGGVTNIVDPPVTGLIFSTNVSGLGSSACSAIVTYAASALPNCGASMKTNFCTPPTGTRFPIGASNVTCKVVDTYNNTNTLIFTLNVDRDPLEEQIKIFSAPKDTNVVVDVGKCTKTNVVYTPVLNSSNLSCFATSGIKTQYCVPPTGKNTFPIGTTPVTCYAYSKSPDNPPAITNFTVTVNAKMTNVVSGQCVVQACDTTVIYTQPTVANNCAGVTVSCVPPSGGIFTNSNSLVPTAFGGNGLTGQVTVVGVTCTAIYASSPVGTTGLTLNVKRHLVPTWFDTLTAENNCVLNDTQTETVNAFAIGGILTNRVKLIDLEGVDRTASVSNTVGVKILFSLRDAGSTPLTGPSTLITNIVAIATNNVGVSGSGTLASTLSGTMVFTNAGGGNMYFAFHARTVGWNVGSLSGGAPLNSTRFFRGTLSVTNKTTCASVTNGVGQIKFQNQ